jgi:hypothetical protein
MNRVIIRDAKLSSAMNEFSKEFADCVIVFLMNLFSEYDQLSLIEKCKDMTTFMISLDLMKNDYDLDECDEFNDSIRSNDQ